MILSPTLSSSVNKRGRGFPTLRILTAIYMAVFLLASQYGCVASRGEISSVDCGE